MYPAGLSSLSSWPPQWHSTLGAAALSKVTQIFLGKIWQVRLCSFSPSRSEPQTSTYPLLLPALTRLRTVGTHAKWLG